MSRSNSNVPFSLKPDLKEIDLSDEEMSVIDSIMDIAESNTKGDYYKNTLPFSFNSDLDTLDLDSDMDMDDNIKNEIDIDDLDLSIFDAN